MRSLRSTTAALICLLAVPATAGAASDYDVTVERSEYGIPHITAADYGSLGYGYARALAQDNLCVVAETYVTVNAQRSRYFGPDGRYAIRGNGSSANNLNSDFFYQRIVDEGRIEKLLQADDGPKPEVLEGVRGFVDGYNDHLESIGGADGVDDPSCKGAEWVRPITEKDVHLSFYRLALLASSGVAIDGIGGAQPLADIGAVDPGSLAPGTVDERLGGLGSNALGIGSDGTRGSGDGLLFGNPHFPWDGSERFYQAHLTIPEKDLNVAGGSLLGVPLVLIGHTDGMAWSHTVSTARRFTPFELRLVPGQPTKYLLDGQVKDMEAREVTVKVRTAGGELEDRTRKLYRSEHGPILTEILGLPIFPWTPERAYAMGDANESNYGRLLNHFFDVNHAQSVDDVDAILEKYTGIPWVNTIAADSKGKAYYADIGTIPNVSDEKLLECRTVLGVALDVAQRLPVLDGSRSSCGWDTDDDSRAPGIFGPSNMPSLERSDFTSNMNDSHWLTNPDEPLEGFARIIGEERTQRSLRTRGGLWLVLERLAGEDGLEGERFTLDQLTAVSMSNRVPAAELWKEQAVAMCRELPLAPTTSGPPVSTAGACDALEAFSGRDDLDEPGAMLFRRFAGRAAGAAPNPFVTQFSASDPVGTPSGLNTAHPQVRAALGDAIKDLQGAGIPLDAPLRDNQFVMRDGEKVSIHGGPHVTGVFNVITPTWNAQRGFTGIAHGSSFVQAVELRDGACPRAKTILTYSQSTNPNSPHSGDQTRLFSEKGWVEAPFCDADMDAARQSGRLKPDVSVSP